MSTLTDDQKQSFMKNGYLIIPQGVSEELVNGALKVTDDAVKDGQVNKKEGPQGSTHPQLGFWQNIRSHSAVMALLYESGLFQIAEQLMGEGNVAIMGDNSQVAYVYQADIHVKEGMDSKKSLKKWCWHVDKPFGDYQAKGADFVLLIGVALSEGQEVDENRGQLTVWPESHYLTHNTMRDAVRTAPAEEVHNTFRKNKPDCGNPVRVLLKKGDVVIAHQRLAHCPGVNLHENIRKNIYFRVLHKRHDELLTEFTESDTPWVGFEGLNDFL